MLDLVAKRAALRPQDPSCEQMYATTTNNNNYSTPPTTSMHQRLLKQYKHPRSSSQEQDVSSDSLVEDDQDFCSDALSSNYSLMHDYHILLERHHQQIQLFQRPKSRWPMIWLCIQFLLLYVGVLYFANYLAESLE